MILADPYVLDDSESIELADPAGVVRAVAGAPAQLREAAFIAEEVDVSALRDGPRPRAVVVVGSVCASAAGAALAALAAPTSPTPVVVMSGDALPAWVGAADIVIGVAAGEESRSPLRALDESVRRGVPVVGVAAEGSVLLDVVRAGRGVVFPVTAGRFASTAFWTLLAPLLVVARALGVARLPTAGLAEAADVLDLWTERCRPSKESFLNPAKELALATADRVPLIWSTSPLSAVAAHRGALQLAARAGMPAMHGCLSAAAEDSLALLDDPAAADRLAVVLLRHDDQSPLVAARVALAQERAADRGVPLHEIAAEGETALTQLASLVAPVDFMSAYAALARGLDPARPTVVAELRRGPGR
ncbi:MAG TPA: SIS domain-containing protein [Mycobacteriales bacterium]|nr:SIS domain-containing protein [Mycobacteriales bacterium]